MEDSHKMVKSTINYMRIVVAKLEKFHQDRVFVDLDQDKDLGIEDTSSPSKRTRASTKKRFAKMPQDIMDLKDMT